MLKEITVAVAGQPNAGKSTVFNMLTGARQHVANYPGVTVEKKVGRYEDGGQTVVLVDLPGTYSLTSYSREERIARDYLIQEKPAAILNIVDAANLERHLYLTFQLAEMGIPLVVALNMMDVAKKSGFTIDAEKLEELLGAPVIPTVGKKNKGGGNIRDAIRQITRTGSFPDGRQGDASDCIRKKPFHVDYGKELESVLTPLEKRLADDQALAERYPTRWLALKLIENDGEARRLVKQEGLHEQGSSVLG